MRSQISVEIDRPVDVVFRLTIERVAEWSIVVVEDEVIAETPEVVGTTFRTVTEDHGKRMEFQGVVTRHDPPRLHAIELTGELFDIESEYRFEDLATGVRVTQATSVTGKGFFRLFMLAFGWLLKGSHCKASEEELASLKRFCESTAAAADA